VPVLVNREEIQQLVLNLVLNAEHALGDNPGTITIRTAAGGNAHSLQVADDGPGIPAELRGRVFEPFFTTKEVGQGTGLGLSIALGIATAHGGSLELCPISKGACFQLTLPAPAVTASPDSPQAQLAVEKTVAGRHALIVDDEAPIRTLLARMVTKRGFTVAEAGSLGEVRSLDPSRHFDLVLCDVRLGDGNGAEALRYLRARQPEIDRRFVFVTGDIAALADNEREFGDLAVLTKPFTAGDLDRLLSDLAVGA
jgi:two-component system NtrC family sensor kinase